MFSIILILLRNVCRECWSNILKKKLKLFSISSFLSILSPLNIKYAGNFLLLHLLVNSVMVAQIFLDFIHICCILYHSNFSRIYFPLGDTHVILKFFSSVPYICESEFVNLRRLYIFVFEFNRVYSTHSNPWIRFMLLMIQSGYHRFHVFVLGRDITLTSQWVRLRPKSPALPLFTQPFIQAQIKENIKAPCHWPLCGEFTGDRWIPRTNGQ